MNILPIDIKEKFYKTLKGDIPIDVFEKWLYENEELEKYLSLVDYQELISLSYKKTGSKYELFKLLKKNIDLGEFETYKILELLNIAKQKTDLLPYVLLELYELFYKGYNFLQDIALGFGFDVEYYYHSLSKVEYQDYIKNISFELDICIENMIFWIETEKIVLTGKQDYLNHYEYIDIRTEKEKKSNVSKLSF